MRFYPTVSGIVVAPESQQPGVAGVRSVKANAGKRKRESQEVPGKLGKSAKMRDGPGRPPKLPRSIEGLRSITQFFRSSGK